MWYTRTLQYEGMSTKGKCERKGNTYTVDACEQSTRQRYCTNFLIQSRRNSLVGTVVVYSLCVCPRGIARDDDTCRELGAVSPSSRRGRGGLNSLSANVNHVGGQ